MSQTYTHYSANRQRHGESTDNEEANAEELMVRAACSDQRWDANVDNGEEASDLAYTKSEDKFSILTIK